MPAGSTFRAHIEVEGASEAGAFLKAFGRRARETRPLMEKMVPVLQQQQVRRVQSQPWAPLSPETVGRKEREHENPGIYRDEARKVKAEATREADALYQAIVSPAHPGQVRRVTRASATFGVDSKKGRSSFWYARIVQQGKQKPGSPTRQILAISQTDAEVLFFMVFDWLATGHKGGWHLTEGQIAEAVSLGKF